MLSGASPFSCQTTLLTLSKIVHDFLFGWFSCVDDLWGEPKSHSYAILLTSFSAVKNAISHKQSPWWRKLRRIFKPNTWTTYFGWRGACVAVGLSHVGNSLWYHEGSWGSTPKPIGNGESNPTLYKPLLGFSTFQCGTLYLHILTHDTSVHIYACTLVNQLWVRVSV